MWVLQAVCVCPLVVPVFRRRDKCPRGYFLPEASWFASEPCDLGSLERGFHQLPEPGFPEGLRLQPGRELETTLRYVS